MHFTIIYQRPTLYQAHRGTIFTYISPICVCNKINCSSAPWENILFARKLDCKGQMITWALQVIGHMCTETQENAELAETRKSEISWASALELFHQDNPFLLGYFFLLSLATSFHNWYFIHERLSTSQFLCDLSFCFLITSTCAWLTVDRLVSFTLLTVKFTFQW